MESGVIQFGSDFIVYHNFSKNDLALIKNKYSIETLVVNGKFESFKSKAIKFNEREVIPTIYFENGLVSHVSIYIVTGGSGWGVQTSAEQEKKKQSQDRWLKHLLNQSPPYLYPWGSIESIYDQKSCVSEVLVSFTKS